ncbi:hypothetical protein BKA81DRAFT_33104 [Phyllosticta paracitricarpa]
MLSAETCPTYPPITVALLGTIAWIPPDCINFERQRRFYEVTEHFDDGTGWRVCYGGVRKTLSKRVGYDDDGMDGRTAMIDPGLDSLSPLGLRLGFLSSLTCAFLLRLVFFFSSPATANNFAWVGWHYTKNEEERREKELGIVSWFETRSLVTAVGTTDG